MIELIPIKRLKRGSKMIDENSKEAYMNLRDSGLLSKRELETYELILFNPNKTARELTKIAGKEDPNYFRPRINELETLGVIKRNGKRVCDISQNTSYIWITNKTSGCIIRHNKKKDVFATKRELDQFIVILNKQISELTQRVIDLENRK